MIHHYSRRSLKAKLAFWSTAAMVVVVLVVTAVALWVVQADIRRSAIDAQTALADSIAKDLDERVDERRTAVIQTAAVLGPLGITDPSGLREHFASRPVVQNLFDVVMTADRHGTLLFDNPQLPGRAGLSIADRDYFKQVMATGRPVISRPLAGRATSEPNIIFAAPLRNATGETDGVLLGLTYLNRPNFLGSLSQMRLGETGYVAVLAKGSPAIIMTHAHRDRVLTQVPANSHVQRGLAGFDGTVEATNSVGLEALFSYRNLKNVPWLVTTAYPTAEAYAAMRSTQQLIIALGLALMLLAGAAIWVLVDRLLAPLERVREAMVASRSRSEPVVLQARDETREIHEMVAAYNALMAHKREAREALRRGEERLKLITDNLPVQIAYIDSQQCYTFVNEPFCRTVGASAQKLLGRSVRDVRGHQVYAQLELHLVGALRGTPAAFESQFTDRGAVGYYRTDYVPDTGSDGEVRGVFAMTQTITEQKLAELRRVRSEERVVGILTHAPDAFIGIDPAGFINEWNRQAELTFGWRRDDVMGLRLSDVIIPEAMRAKHEAGLERFRKSGAGPVINNRIEVLAVRRDGSEIPVELSVASVRDGDQFGAHAFLRDITDRKAAEAKLAASELRLRMIADNLPVLISYIDREERMQFLNETYREWTDIDPVAALGRTVSDIVGPARYEPRRAHLADALAGKRVEFDIVSTTQATPRHLHTVYVPDVDESGKVLGLYALSADVTALKAIENKLQEQARVDPLTGLPNRRAFDERLRECVARSRRNRKRMALMFLDIDHFKSINDTHGHGVGDQVLQEFARRLLSCVRQTDTVARLAGDEFVIILEGLGNVDESAAVAQKIGMLMRIPFRVGEEIRRVSTSIGVAYVDDNKAEPASVVDKADGALYRAKRNGRNTFAVTTW